MKTMGKHEFRSVRKWVSSLKPSPENESIYQASNPGADQKLEDSIRKNGLLEPLVITEDNFVVAGHRRLRALQRIGRGQCYCRVLPIRRDDVSTDEYLELLRAFNLQRDKTVGDTLAESVIDFDPFENWWEGSRSRVSQLERLRQPKENGVGAIEIEGRKKRFGISDEKAEHVKCILKVVKERKPYWPLSIRGVHYPLLNFVFFRNIPRKLRYLNDPESYDATSDLITRLRLAGKIPWEAFDDPTRPYQNFPAFSNVRRFIEHEVDRLFWGYWRRLQQSQPRYIELVVEKNTLYHLALRVSEKYHIPTSSGRGFNSIDPWHDLFERYQASRKKPLSVIIVSDWDPEGEMIPQVAGRTLRDDFGVKPENLRIIKAGVTRQQISKHKLPTANFAKESSPNHDWFVKRNDGDDSVYEVEALDPKLMLRDLDRVIRHEMDIKLFNIELAKEKEEIKTLDRIRFLARAKMLELMKGVDL